MTHTNPFQLSKQLFDDVPIDFWAQVRSFLEYGYVIADPYKYFCLAYPVDSDGRVETWVLGSGGYVDAWYIHLFGGGDMACCIEKLLAIHDLPKICFYRWKNGKQGHLRCYNKDKLLQRLKSE